MSTTREDKTRDAPKFGAKIRAVRRCAGLSQAELAKRLGVSPSYLNLLEHDKRALPAELLIRLTQVLQVDLASFAGSDDARLVHELIEAFADPLFEDNPLTSNDVRELASASPTAARAVLQLYRAYRGACVAADAMSSQIEDGDDAGAGPRAELPSEEVSDLLQQHMNYFPDLEARAEALRREAGFGDLDRFGALVRHLQRAHGIKVELVRWDRDRPTLRRYDPDARVLSLSELLPTRSRLFQLATQVALIAHDDALDAVARDPIVTGPDSRALARVALANYFAGAVIMPYDAFLRAAEESRYDIDVLGRRFGVGFEQTCHRLTTLRRPGAEGVPFHMMRIDVAGNISKRFSASGIRFARFSGVCPRWNIFSAFQTPNMIRVQVSHARRRGLLLHRPHHSKRIGRLQFAAAGPRDRPRLPRRARLGARLRRRHRPREPAPRHPGRRHLPAVRARRLRAARPALGQGPAARRPELPRRLALRAAAGRRPRRALSAAGAPRLTRDRACTILDHVPALPLLDIAPLLRGEPGPRLALARQLIAACRELGFFYVVGHGVDPELFAALTAASRRFFALPAATKLEIAMARAGRAWRGYFPLGGELTSGVPDHKEGLYFGAEHDDDAPGVRAGWPMHGRNLFPAEVPELRPAVLDVMAALTRVGHALIAGLGLGLDLGDDYFARHYTADPTVLFRVFHYPPAVDDAWGVGEHTDYGLLTLLAQDEVGGLQVRTPRGWLDAPPIPGALVCNIGDMLELISGGALRSTPHRVRNTSARDRLSFPFFFDPAFSADLRPLPRAAGAASSDRWDHADVHAFRGTYGEYLLAKIGKVFPDLRAAAPSSSISSWQCTFNARSPRLVIASASARSWVVHRPIAPASTSRTSTASAPIVRSCELVPWKISSSRNSSGGSFATASSRSRRRRRSSL